jgi:hypothetical protein
MASLPASYFSAAASVMLLLHGVPFLVAPLLLQLTLQLHLLLLVSCVLLASLLLLSYSVTGVLPVSDVVAGVHAVAGIHNGVVFSAVADMFASLPAITGVLLCFCKLPSCPAVLPC